MEKDPLYYPASLPERRAITMVAHGLNTKPMAMRPLIDWLTQQGSDVYLVALSGHCKEGIKPEQVTAAIWENEMLAVYHQAKSASLAASVPLYFLGYSLGALLGQSILALSQKEAPFAKQVLIAPATAIRRRSYLLKILFVLGGHLRIPSFTPKAYRVHHFLPLRIYRLLFAEEKKVLRAKFKGLNMPTLIIMDPKDELISYKKLIRLVKKFKLTQYEIVVIHKEVSGRSEKFHHLILDETTMGKENWKMVRNKIKQFFFNS